MRRDPPPLTHGSNADYLSAELDYDEMIALAGILRQRAIGKNPFNPQQRTGLVAFSEELAQGAGKAWRATDPVPETSPIKLVARVALEYRNVIKLEHAKHWLGIA